MKSKIFAGAMIVALTAGPAYGMMNCGMMGGHGSHSDHGSEGNAARSGVRGELRDAQRERVSWYEAEQDRIMPDNRTSEDLRQDVYQEESASTVKKHNH